MRQTIIRWIQLDVANLRDKIKKEVEVKKEQNGFVPRVLFCIQVTSCDIKLNGC